MLVAWLWLTAASALHAETCMIDKVIALPLGYTEGLATVPAKIDGTDVTLGIDTGAQTLVTPQTAARFHLARDYTRRTREIGATGVTVANNFVLRGFEFAGKRYGFKSVVSISLAAPQASASKGNAEALAGLLGADVLSEYDVDLDLANRSLSLYRVRGCSKVTPPWSEPYTPFHIRVTGEHHVVLPVEVDGTELTALLDTGATGFAISRKAAIKAGATEAMLKDDPLQELTGVGGIAAKQPSHKFKTVVLGGETIRNLPLQLMPVQLPGADVLVGQVYLLFRHVWISYSTRSLFIGAPRIPNRQLLPEPFAKLFPPAPAAPAPPSPPLSASLPSCPNGSCPPNRLPGIAPPAFQTPAQQDWRAAASHFVKKPEGFAGMETVSLSAGAIQTLQIGKDQGIPVLVLDVVPGGPAGEAGIRPGDIILSVDGLAVFGSEAFADLVKVKGEGQKLELSIVRERQKLALALPLAGLEQMKKIEEADSSANKIERIVDLETSIGAHYRQTGFEADIALSSVRLGDALRDRTMGDRQDNLGRAATAYLDALRTLSPNDNPISWARAQFGLGSIYLIRDAGAGKDDLEKAIERLEAAFKVRLTHGLNSDLAQTSLKLGLAYLDRADGVAQENAAKSIAYLKRSLDHYTAIKTPKDYGIANAALARAYLRIAPQPAGDALDDAIVAYERALFATDRKIDPDQAAKLDAALEALRVQKVALRPKPTPEEEKTVTECDQLAGGPFDPDRVTEGVRREQIDADKAIPACEEAVAVHPAVRRFHYQLARALHAKEPARAAQIYRTLALEGHAPAMLNLAAFYALGRGVPQDKSEALRLARQSADSGFPFGIFALGTYYRKGNLGIQDKEEAARLYRKAAALGLPDALFGLADMFGKGEIAADKSEMQQVYREASALGNPAATYYLGVIFEKGDGVPENKAEAAKLYRTASDRGNGAATYRLALLYEKGEGVPEDKAEAQRLFKRATELGYKQASAP